MSGRRKHTQGCKNREPHRRHRALGAPELECSQKVAHGQLLHTAKCTSEAQVCGGLQRSESRSAAADSSDCEPDCILRRAGRTVNRFQSITILQKATICAYIIKLGATILQLRRRQTSVSSYNCVLHKPDAVENDKTNGYLAFFLVVSKTTATMTTTTISNRTMIPSMFKG